MDEPIKVFTTPGCAGCALTQRVLQERGIAYVVVDLTTDDDALQRFRDMGLRQAPIVEDPSTGAIWSGFRPDLVADLEPVAVR